MLYLYTHHRREPIKATYEQVEAVDTLRERGKLVKLFELCDDGSIAGQLEHLPIYLLADGTVASRDCGSVVR
jgi:hypothetical protein